MTKRRLLICDDIPKRARGWADRLMKIDSVRGGFDVAVASEPDLRNCVHEMQERRRRAREGKTPGGPKVLFDDVAILLVDFDLLAYDDLGVDTGERIAYLARCYSTCGYIVELNQFGEYWFDLTLRDHPESFADLNLGGGHLHNRGLWSEPFQGFRPWVWPLVPQAALDLERRVKQVRSCLGEPILDFLGFPPEVRARLPRSVREYLGPAESPTFREFVSSSPLGLKPMDAVMDDEAVARIAAARLGKWLEVVVLPGQDILIDAPHLAHRFPSLLNAKPTLRTFNTTTSLKGPSNTGLYGRRIAAQQLKPKAWLSRPAWFWPMLARDEDIAEVRQPWNVAKSAYQFCEDASRFLTQTDTRQFVADVASPYVTRFVISPDSAYAKRFRASVKRDPRSLAGVAYRPAARLAA